MSSSNDVTDVDIKGIINDAIACCPIDLTKLLQIAYNQPHTYIYSRRTLERLVTLTLNQFDENKSNKDVKLKMIDILSCMSIHSKDGLLEVKNALQVISEDYDSYISSESLKEEPKLNKAMIILLSRCWEYNLKAQDILELTKDNRKLAIHALLGLLNDCDKYYRHDSSSKTSKYNKELIFLLVKLFRGLTQPQAYFKDEITVHSVEKFTDEIDNFIHYIYHTNIIQCISKVVYTCLFTIGIRDALNEEKSSKGGSKTSYNSTLKYKDHDSIINSNVFFQNIYYYTSYNGEEYAEQLLLNDSYIPLLVLPYLDRCIATCSLLNSQLDSFIDCEERVNKLMDNYQEVMKGVATSLHTLIIIFYNSSAKQKAAHMLGLFSQFNVTSQFLQSVSVCSYHDYIFVLLCLLSVNTNALVNSSDNSSSRGQVSGVPPEDLVDNIILVYRSMSTKKQQKAYNRILYSGSLPVDRDAASYTVLKSMLSGVRSKDDDGSINSDERDGRDFRYSDYEDLCVVESIQSKVDKRSIGVPPPIPW